MASANSLNISETGYVVFDETTNDFHGRTFQEGTGITISNANGVSGNTTISVNGSFVGETITGNIGGARSPVGGNWNIVTANSTIVFAGTGNSLTQDFSPNPLNNIVFGSTMPSVTTGNNNVGIGHSILNSVTSGQSNFALGASTMNVLTTGNSNVGVGSGSLGQLTTGNFNVSIGGSSLNNISTGTNNISIGQSAGGGYTTSDSSNICIGNNGTTPESNTIRIGTQGSSTGQQNTCYIAGIAGVSVSNLNVATINTSTGQMGSTATLALANGGTNASLVASNGGIFYSTATAGAILAGTATAGQIIRSGASGAPSWSTATYPATAGTSGNVLTSDGTNWTSAAPAAGGIDTVTGQIFTSSGAFTYTPTAGMTYVIVELVGGGGGSGGCASASAGNSSVTGGGASGGYAKFILTAAQVGAGLSGSVGVGGAAGASGNNNGTAGGDTTLATTAAWTVKGGGASAGSAAGTVATDVVHAGGTSSANTTGTGTILANIQGQNGKAGYSDGNSFVSAGDGGSIVLGFGGVGIYCVINAAFSAGIAGTGYGAGASGAADAGQSNAPAGAAGTTGIAIFTEFTT